ncbi:MAG TPA: MmgE/PrpD family protein [Chloroflexi bacterium]|nr:MAG: MmgE/PrpD family protein [Chloroflexota bacterium]HDD55457.1 MmgE/PrpD family protein [Chloroflexota bacterium]
MMSSLSGKMAQWALDLQFEDIPEKSIWEAKRFLLDSMGCALAAVNNEDMEAMYRFTEKLGGTPEASVIGREYKTNASNAALMNCLLTRAMDYNDIYWEEDPSHPSDLIGAALAAGEVNGKSGKEVLEAIIVNYELMLRWCHAAHPGVREIGWHHASLVQFVSPVVAGKLYDLDLDQMVAAVGISSSSHFTLGGVVAGHLTNMKNTAAPLASQAGVIAAMIAKENYSGPVEVFEGKEGVFEVIDSVEWRPEWVLKDLGKEFMITKCAYKAFPTEALTHQPISAAMQVCQEQNLAAEDISEVLVETTIRGADILSDPSKFKPKTKETADHSLPYVVAAAVADGNVLPSSFSDEKLKDPRIWDLLGKIKVVADPEIDAMFPGVKRARVTITNNEGQSFTAQVDNAKGSPLNPMSDEEIISKFRANAGAVLSVDQQDKVIDLTWRFDELEEISSYMELLQ